MRIKIVMLCVFCTTLALTPYASATVSVTATLLTGDNKPVPVSFLRLDLVRCGNNIPQIPSRPGSIVTKQLDLPPDQITGFASGTVFANNEITCGGSYSTLWHVTAFSDANTPIAGDYDYQICSPSGDPTYCGTMSGTWDLALAMPFEGNLPPPGFQAIYGNPVSDQTIKQPTGTALVILGTLDLTNANVVGFTGGGTGGTSTILINSGLTAAASVNFNKDLPAAPALSANVIWQKDALNPTNVSAYVPYATPSIVGLMRLNGDFCQLGYPPDFSSAFNPQICSLHLASALPVLQGGTGQTTAAAAFNSLAPSTAIGGMIVGSAANTYTNVPAGTAAYCWISNGPSVLPSWQPCSALTGGITNSLTKWSSTSTVAPATGITETAGTFASTDTVDFGSAVSFKVPTGASVAPTANGLIAYNSTANSYYVGSNGTGKILAYTTSSITGNAATATASDHSPSQCTANQFSTGVTTAWAANCAQPSSSNLSDSASLVRTNADNTYGAFTYDFSGTAAMALKTTSQADPNSPLINCTRSASRMDVVLSTGSTNGQNLWFCTATNVWTQQLNSGAGGANTTLANLGVTAINAVLQPATAGGLALGSNALPWSDVFIGTSATNNIQLTGTATSAKVATLPNNSGTIAELNFAQTWTATQTFADIKGATLTSTNALPATAGVIRLTHTDLMEFRNAANTLNTVVLGMEAGTDWIALGSSNTSGLKFPSAVATNTAGGQLTIQPTANTGNGNGGNFNLFAGNGAGTGANGDLVLQGGAGGSGSIGIVQANSALAVPLVNDGVTGTVQYQFVSNVAGKAMVTAAGSSIPPVGVCMETCGLSGTARIAQVGTVPLLLDAVGTIGDLVCMSASADGNGTDCGLVPNPGQIVRGQIVSLVSGTTYNVLLNLGGQSTIAPNVLVNNPGTSQVIQSSAPTIVGLTVKAPAGIGISTNIFQVQDPSGNNIFNVLKDASGNYTVQYGTGSSGNVLANWFGSSAAILSSTGILRMGTTDCGSSWRNNANTGDVTICKDASDVITVTGAPSFKSLGQIVSTGGTVTSSTPGFAMTQTWNAAATFSGILSNITATSFNAGSKVLEFQFGGTAFFNIATGATTAVGPVLNLAGTAPIIATASNASLAINPNGTGRLTTTAQFTSANHTRILAEQSVGSVSATALTNMGGWIIPANKDASFECHATWQQKTAVSTVTFSASMSSAAGSPTLAITSAIRSNTTTAAVTQTTSITTTATTAITAATAPNAFGVNYQIDWFGTLVGGSAANTLTFYIQSGNASDAAAIELPSFCQLY